MSDKSLKIEMLTSHLSERMKRLCRDVLERLPPDWDDHRTFDIGESDDRPSPRPGTVGYGSAGRDEEGESLQSELPPDVKPEQCWRVTLYVKHLALLSDQAVRWVIAHELGHVASGLRTGSLVIGDIPVTRVTADCYEPAPARNHHEDAADTIALGWGFTEELQRFLAETES